MGDAVAPPTQIPDADALIQVVKACLRTPNQHLTTATLSALPPLVPLLVTRPPAQIPLPSSSTSPAASTSSATSSPVDAHALRQVLTQLMPAGGGVIDRLGDSRERAREKARETLVAMGGFAFRCGGTGSQMGRSRDGKGPEDRKSTRLNSSHSGESRMPSAMVLRTPFFVISFLRSARAASVTPGPVKSSTTDCLAHSRTFPSVSSSASTRCGRYGRSGNR